LQASSIDFQPGIEAKLQSARQLSVGSAMRVTLVCKEPFWETQLPSARGENLAKLSFMHVRAEQFPTWWTSYPLQAKTITAWAGGPKAASIAALDTADQISIALDSLAHATGLSRSALEELVENVYHHDWQKDPFSRGAYSYVPAGAMSAIERLADPCDETLFFAGEATDTSGHTGTVHGAIASGLRAADQVITQK
jgi:monoamine oxidase